MLTVAVALVVYVAAAFFPGDPQPRYAVFSDQAECDAAVAQVRESGVFATDCAPVTLGAPRVGVNKGA